MKKTLLTLVLSFALLITAIAAEAFTYSTTAKNNRLDAVATTIGNAGILTICTASCAATLVTYTLGSPCCGAASGAVLTFSGFPKTSAATGTGTAAAAKITTSGAVNVITGLTVATSAADIIIDSTSITSGQNVTVNASPTITHALNRYLNGDIQFAQLKAIVKFTALASIYGLHKVA